MKKQKQVLKIARKLLERAGAKHAEINELSKEVRRLRELVYGKRGCLLPVTLYTKIIAWLPDANLIGNHFYDYYEGKGRQVTVKETLDGVEYPRLISLESQINEMGERGAVVIIHDYQIQFFIPLRLEVTNYNLFGVHSNINTYIWDIYRSGVRIVTDDAWAFLLNYVKAQSNVMKEFKGSGLF